MSAWAFSEPGRYGWRLPVSPVTTARQPGDYRTTTTAPHRQIDGPPHVPSRGVGQSGAVDCCFVNSSSDDVADQGELAGLVSQIEARHSGIRLTIQEAGAAIAVRVVTR